MWSDYIPLQLGLVCGLYTVAVRVGVWSEDRPLQLGLVCGLTIPLQLGIVRRLTIFLGS